MKNFKALIVLGRHLMSAAFLLFVLVGTISAYSIVMRGGKRIEIPAHFSVTNMTLTYEASPGFTTTLPMADVDIPATERANNEMPGSLLGRATGEKEPPRTSADTSQPRESKASRTITNSDLESFKNVRLKSEREYEQRLKEQGLPPLAVMRAQAAADAQRFAEELARQRAEAEARERDAQLQAQIAALNAQLNYVQSQSDESSFFSPDLYTFYGGVPFFGGHSRVNPALRRIPFGVAVGGAFGSFHVPLVSPSRFDGFRGNIIVAPGTRGGGGRGGFGGGPHVRPR